jgi:hypothetical protein
LKKGIRWKGGGGRWREGGERPEKGKGDGEGMEKYVKENGNLGDYIKIANCKLFCVSAVKV